MLSLPLTVPLTFTFVCACHAQIIRSLFVSKAELQNEVQILRATCAAHANIVRICGSGSDYTGGGPFLLLEYLPNGSLADRLATPVPKVRGLAAFSSSAATSLFTVRLIAALDLAVQLAAALVFLHEHALEAEGQSILYLALMPQHLGFAADGTLRLLDFGAAAVVSYGSAKERPAVSDPAALRYAAPEALAGGGCTTAADVFGFTALVWCMLSHSVPHASVHDASVAAAVRGGVREPLNPRWSPELRELLTQGWAAEPESRYADTANAV
jgi:serine/threonine protein kinase